MELAAAGARRAGAALRAACARGNGSSTRRGARSISWVAGRPAPSALTVTPPASMLALSSQDTAHESCWCPIMKAPKGVSFFVLVSVSRGPTSAYANRDPLAQSAASVGTVGGVAGEKRCMIHAISSIHVAAIQVARCNSRGSHRGSRRERGCPDERVGEGDGVSKGHRVSGCVYGWHDRTEHHRPSLRSCPERRRVVSGCPLRRSAGWQSALGASAAARAMDDDVPGHTAWCSVSSARHSTSGSSCEYK